MTQPDTGPITRGRFEGKCYMSTVPSHYVLDDPSDSWIKHDVAVTVTDRLLIINVETGSLARHRRRYVCALISILAVWEAEYNSQKRIGVLLPGGLCTHLLIDKPDDLFALLTDSISQARFSINDDGPLASSIAAQQAAQQAAAAAYAQQQQANKDKK